MLFEFLIIFEFQSMTQSLTKNYIHVVFHTKYNQPLIKKQDCDLLYAYIGSVLKENGCTPIAIGGVADHVHVLFILSKNIALSRAVELLKKHSSRWIKTINISYEHFSWQGGYGAFSVSPSVLEKTKKYILNQETHHDIISFKEEVAAFMKEYELEYDPDLYWKDE
jgi:REP element-mobilizing transposase RayT